MWLFLDDKRKDPTVVHNINRGLGIAFGKSNNWIIARDYHSFIDILVDNFDYIDFISFDHDISSYDLSDNELTGKDAAQFLLDYCMDNNKLLPDWFVHSDNTGGNENIRKLFISYMYRVENRISSDRLTYCAEAYGFIDNKFYFNR